MEIETEVGPGRPVWTTKIYNGFYWDADGLLDLLKVRCRALIAAAFAEGNWHEWPWRPADWRPVAVATRKALSLFIQAEAGQNSTAEDEELPQIKFRVELEGLPPVEHVIGTPNNRVSPKITCEFQTSVSGTSQTGSITVSFMHTAPHDVAYKYVQEVLEFQASLRACPELHPRRGFGTTAAISIDEKRWDARVRFSDFLRRFLQHYDGGRSSDTPIDPFMAFFLVPRSWHRNHIASGMWGYRYQLDEGQAQFLKENGVAPEVLEGNNVDFPEGLCSHVYLSGRAVDAVSTEVLFRKYQNTSDTLRRIEDKILRSDSVLIEVPVYDAGLIDRDVAPDGPECILGVCIPKARRAMAVAAPRRELLASMIEPPSFSGFEPGECQAVFEMAHHLISRYVLIRPSVARSGLVGNSPAMRVLQDLIEKFARQPQHVLILGESGSGKELVAKAVKELSPRASKPFVSLNCAAIPENLIESELFGHVKGAFTGAIADKAGKFQTAHQGTLFLDEIGELTGAAQAKLLRAVQFGQVERVGSTKEEFVDVRVIAATRKNLEEETRNGNFRDDLFYRLNALTISVPPLRNHLEDVPDLVESYLAKHHPHHLFDDLAMRMLMNYTWGKNNVRELENIITRVIAHHPDLRTITADHVAPHLPESLEAPEDVR